MPVRLVSQEELPYPLNGYRMIERLGRGGFGEVWKVEAPGGLEKAAKFVFGDLDSVDDEGRPAVQELKALDRVKRIRHPYILSLERIEQIDGQLIIIMELADRNLWDRFRECRAQGRPGVPRDELLRYLEEAAEALDLMNDRHNLQHLDVKPQNLFLVHNHVKVADFGLAKLFDGARGTVTGGVTPVYAPPETFEGWVSRFTDQYSLAIVYQELLTGTRPFNGANTKQLLLQHLYSPPDLAPLPDGDRAAIDRALSKKPDDRWPSCADLVRALKQAGAVSPGGGPLDHTRSATDTPRPAGPLPATPPSSARPTVFPPLTPGNRPAVSTPIPTGGRPVPPAAPRPPGGSGVLVRGSLPGLVTPQLVTPRAAAGNAPPPGMTIQRAPTYQTERMSGLGIAPPDRSGDGVLFPALMVAVGQIGLAVLKAFRQVVRDRFGGLDTLPTVRYLYIDTDPDAVAAATQGPDALAAREVVLAALNRPSHYLQQSVAPNLDAWMPPGMLYRLPKNPGPAAGVRAFGRLALCDNYRGVAQRVRQELEAFLSDDPLEKAAAQTGLGLRSNRPRAYVLAGLAGGTGSGMLVDLAYIVKHEMRATGYGKPEAVGVLLVPPADKSAPKSAALANAHAALAEVRHFTGGHKYHVRFDANEPPVSDGDGPFARCAVLQLPKAPKPKDQAQVFGLAAQGLALETITPAGRVTDHIRSVAPVPPHAAAPVAQLFGAYRLAWPRSELLATATRRFAQRLLQGWAGKEAPHLREPIHAWLTDQWAKLRLAPAEVVGRFEKAARDALREDPRAVFDAAVDALVPGARTGKVDVTAVAEVFDQLLRLVGKPDADQESPSALEVAVRDVSKQFATEIEAHLSATSVSFIEQPQYRLAGAEEVLNQLTARITQTVGELEGARDELARGLRDGYARLFQLLGGLGVGSGLSAVVARRAAQAGELTDALRSYPHKRYQLIVLDAALTLYRGLLSNLPEYLRDVNYCRQRLGELGQALADPAAGSGLVGPGTLILPAGCKSVDDMADQFLSALAAEEILGFDQALQKDVAKRFRGVANVCLKPNRSADFLALLRAQARAFLETRFEQVDPATAVLRYRGDGPDAQAQLAEGFVKAASGLTPASPDVVEAVVFAAPPGAAGDRLRWLAEQACPGVEFIPAPLPTDVVIYREFPRVELSALPQLGQYGREAYDTQLAAEQFPHTRADVLWDV